MKSSLPIALCAAALFLTPVFAEDGEASRSKIQELEERARVAKEQGRPEEANELMAKAKRLRVEAGEGEGKREGGDKNEMVKRRIGELRKEGKQDEADQLEQRWRASMEKQGEKKDPGYRKEREPGEKKDPGFRKEQEPGSDMDRAHHMKEAIRHLHAAGLHEPAARIEQLLREGDFKRQPVDREHRKDAVHGNLKSPGPRDGDDLKPHAKREPQDQALREAHEQIAKLARSVEELRQQFDRQRAEGERRKD